MTRPRRSPSSASSALCCPACPAWRCDQQLGIPDFVTSLHKAHVAADDATDLPQHAVCLLISEGIRIAAITFQLLVMFGLTILHL
jgi:hypothetical protein